MSQENNQRGGGGQGGRNPRNNNNSNNNNNNNRRRHHNRPHPPHQNGQREGGQEGRLDFQKVLHKYENFLEQHLNARRKYFEQFYRTHEDGRARLEHNFFKSIEQLRDFEEKLPDDVKILLKNHIDRYREDNIYTQNHELPLAPPKEEIVTKIEDPHRLESQKQAKYAHDAEESNGSLDDYYAYKGVPRIIPDESKEKH